MHTIFSNQACTDGFVFFCRQLPRVGLEAPVLKVLIAQGPPVDLKRFPTCGHGKYPWFKTLQFFQRWHPRRRMSETLRSWSRMWEPEGIIRAEPENATLSGQACVGLHPSAARRAGAVPAVLITCTIGRQPSWSEPCESFCTPFRVLPVLCRPCIREVGSDLQTFRLTTRKLLRVTIGCRITPVNLQQPIRAHTGTSQPRTVEYGLTSSYAMDPSPYLLELATDYQNVPSITRGRLSHHTVKNPSACARKNLLPLGSLVPLRTGTCEDVIRARNMAGRLHTKVGLARTNAR